MGHKSKKDPVLQGAKLSFVSARLIKLKQVLIKLFSPCTGLNSVVLL